MCEVLLSKVHYSGCPASCDKEDKTTMRCPKAIEKGEDCKDAKETFLAKSTNHDNCPNHRDEGYSTR
jgi:hypothetical protein